MKPPMPRHFLAPNKSDDEPFEEDYYRMIWAITRVIFPILVFFIFACLLTNCFLYRNRWARCARSTAPENECNKDKLPRVFKAREVTKLIWHMTLVMFVSISGIVSVVINSFVLSYLSGMSLIVLWYGDYFDAKDIVLTCSATMYNCAHICHLVTALTLLLFSGTVFRDRYALADTEFKGHKSTISPK